MKKLTLLNATLSLILLSISGYSFYKVDEYQKNVVRAHIKINELEKEKNAKEKELTENKKEISLLEKKLVDNNKELEITIDPTSEKSEQKNHSNLTNDSTDIQTTQSVPATEYKTPTDQDNKKIAEQYANEQEEQSKPVYVIYDDNYKNLYRFADANNVSLSTLYELNPHLTDAKDFVKGNSYRVK